MTNNTNAEHDVTREDLVRRINRQLSSDRRILMESRMEESPSFGNFYADTNEIADREGSIDIESIGRELGVLGEDETYAGNTAVEEPEAE